MGTGKQRRKNNVAKKKKFHRLFKNKGHTKDLDQVYEDINNPNKQNALLNQDIDEDLPGFGQFYCLHCARYFTDNNNLQAHFKTKLHKQVVKRLKEKPYSHEDAEKIQY